MSGQNTIIYFLFKNLHRSLMMYTEKRESKWLSEGVIVKIGSLFMFFRGELVFFFMIMLENGATLEGGAVFPLIIMFQNSAVDGAELRTRKRLQGWSHFGSTFFLSVIQFSFKYMLHGSVGW